MRVRRFRSPVALAGLLACGALPAAPPPEAAIADLGFLAGRWRGGSWDATYSSPDGGIILSFAKDLKPDGTLGFFEFERIEARDGGVWLTPSPRGKPSVAFRLLSLDPAARRAVFENPEHDFPSRIVYHRDREDRLVFELSGRPGGKPQQVRVELSARAPEGPLLGGEP